MLIKYFYLIFLISLVFATEDAPEVKIEQGALKGRILKTQHGRAFNAFTGIPYAKAPVGPLRFEAPVSADPWEGVLDATKSHAICPQINTFFKNFTVIGDEDCLFLNVYTPQCQKVMAQTINVGLYTTGIIGEVFQKMLHIQCFQLPGPEDKPLPVMFFVHGGGWFLGSGASEFYGPELLLDKDIVLVVANYRLGPLGFFTTGDEVVPGNNGLKDQAFVLKWIHKNIAKFGGDPEKVTVFGQSAGGASAQFHMYSPLSRDLIKGAISQSGSSFCFLGLGPIDVVTNRSRTVATHFDCPTDDSKKMIECLRKVKANDIVEQMLSFLEFDIDPMTIFKPVVEPNVEGAFLPEDPIDTVVSGKAAKIPFMTGIATEDGAFRTAGIFDTPGGPENLNDFKKSGPPSLGFGEFTTSDVKDSVSQQIKHFYFGDKLIDDSTRQNFTKMYTDAIFMLPTEISVDLHLKFYNQPLYYYVFGYQGSKSVCPLFGNGTFGEPVVCHGDDLLYLLTTNEMTPDYKQTESDQKVTELLITLWTNFAKYGNPTPETDSTISVKWEPVQKDKKNYYVISSGSDVKIKQDLLYEERVHFWTNLPIDSRMVRIKGLL